MNNTAPKPVDIDHLNRYTGGDRALNGQILNLFDGQCHEILEKLETQLAGPMSEEFAKNWHDSAHALKGAARGVGAFSLADSAADAEKTATTDRQAVIAVLGQLKAKAATVHDFIAELIRTENTDQTP